MTERKEDGNEINVTLEGGQTMSVIATGTQLPICCSYCFALSDNLSWCKLSKNEIYNPVSINGRPSFCPLRPLPEKHGRLIDADAFKAMCRENVEDLRDTVTLPHEKAMVERLAEATEALCLDLDEAPTIVEAEGD